jgi:hypothetical protein
VVFILEGILYEWETYELTESMDTVQYNVTMKWLPIVFVGLVLQNTNLKYFENLLYTGTAKISILKKVCVIY